MAVFRYKLISKFEKLDKEVARSILNNFGISIDSWESPKYHIYIVYVKKEIVAYGCLRGHDAELAYFGPTWVKLEYRGKGLQKKLIKKRLQLAKKLGYIKAISSTFTDNHASNNSLIVAGFRLRESWMEPQLNSLYWEKTL